MPESVEPTTSPAASAWAETLKGMFRACLNKPQPILSEVKAYLRALQNEGENPQQVYEELVAQRNPALPPAPDYQSVAPPPPDASSAQNSTPPETPPPSTPEAAPSPPPERRVSRTSLPS